MYRYETHLHTAPVSKCAKATVQESLEYYKSIGYAGVFITNHFLDGNISGDRTAPYQQQIEFYFSDYEEGAAIGKQIGLQVFCGVELSYKGTDFLIYGLDKAWYLAHPEIMEMKKSEVLPFMMEAGALVIQAHPFREARYIDHIRLYPRHVHGIEIINASRKAEENALAEIYCKHYDLLPFAGSDNHTAGGNKKFAGMEADTPLMDMQDFIDRIKNRKMQVFHWEKEE